MVFSHTVFATPSIGQGCAELKPINFRISAEIATAFGTLVALFVEIDSNRRVEKFESRWRYRVTEFGHHRQQHVGTLLTSGLFAPPVKWSAAPRQSSLRICGAFFHNAHSVGDTIGPSSR